MKLILLLLSTWCLNGFAQEVQGIDLFLGADSESEIQLFLNFTQTLDHTDQCALALHGTALTMSASFGFNPITKLNRFSKGKELIESAISQGNNEACSHFCRLAVQSQAPSFLAYNEHIEKDAVIVVSALNDGWLSENTETRKSLIKFLKNETEINPGLKAKLEKL